MDDADNDYSISTLQKERQSDTRLPFYLIKFTSIKNNNPEVYSCEQGQQGLTLANIGNYLYFARKHDAADIQKTQNSYTAMGVYNNDKMVASFTFGFWTYLFTKRNYRVGGKTLLKIFPNKAHGLKQSDIYRELTAIREFRNRIAHHEPICFNAARTIDTTYARSHYNLIRTYIGYMGFDPDSVLRAVEKPDSILNMIDGI